MTGEVTVSALRERDAAHYIGVSPRTLRRYRDRREIAFSRLSPRVVVYRIADLEEFIATRATAPVVLPMTRR